MRELRFEQVESVGGATCGAADVAKDFMVGVFAFVGGVIGGATSFGIGSVAGGFVGAMAGSGAWQASKQEIISTLCHV
jgi:hypothetical protein